MRLDGTSFSTSIFSEWTFVRLKCRKSVFNILKTKQKKLLLAKAVFKGPRKEMIL